MSKAAATSSMPGPTLRSLGSVGNGGTSPVLSSIDPPVPDNATGSREGAASPIAGDPISASGNAIKQEQHCAGVGFLPAL